MVSPSDKDKGVRQRRRFKITVAMATALLVTTVLAASIVPCVLFLLDDNSHTQTESPIRVAAFNVRQFGRTFMGKPDSVSGLVRIFQRYDLVLVQEVRDSTHKALDDLQATLNSTTPDDWLYLSSAPLGRSRYYKEQYVYFYKPSRVKVVSSYQVADSDLDVYEREPFAVEIEYASKGTYQQRVVLMGLHAKPTSAKEELTQAAVSVLEVSRRFPDVGGVVLMGDFNADCSYLSGDERDGLELFRGSHFTSLIPDGADTTVARSTDCAYDRVVVYVNQTRVTGSVDARAGAVFNFETLLKIGEDEAKEISDHYPVEFSLY